MTAALAVLLLAAVPLPAQQESVVDQVVQMLEAELSEEIILEWLEGEKASLGSLGASELVALKKAGASDDLIKQVLTLSREAREAPEPAVPPTPAESAPAEAPESTGTSGNPTGAPVTFHISYQSMVDEYEVAGDRAWDLYVYIDGIPVTYVPTQRLSNRPEILEFARTLPAGTHTVRVTQERHLKARGRWQHETRAAAQSFEFELEPEAPARLEVSFHQRLMDYSDPLTFQLTQGQKVLDTGRIGGDAELWPALCQDLQASVPEGKKPSREQRQRLETCVDWEEWWSGLSVPSRSEVLAAMAKFDFRPRPRGS